MTTIFLKLQHSTPSSFAIDCRIRLSSFDHACVRFQLADMFLISSGYIESHRIAQNIAEDTESSIWLVPIIIYSCASIADWLTSGAISLDWPNLAAKNRGPVWRLVRWRVSVRTELVP